MTTSSVATVEVPFEALVKEPGSKRVIKFISEIRSCYCDSFVELRKATETLTLEKVKSEVKTLKKKKRMRSWSITMVRKAFNNSGADISSCTGSQVTSRFKSTFINAR